MNESSVNLPDATIEEKSSRMPFTSISTSLQLDEDLVEYLRGIFAAAASEGEEVDYEMVAMMLQDSAGI